MIPFVDPPAGPTPASAAGDGAEAPSARIRERLLDAVLPRAGETGWTSSALAAAAGEAGLSEGELALACPRGAVDLLDAWALRAERAATLQLAAAASDGLRIRAKATLGVRAYVGTFALHKPACRRAVAAPDRAMAGGAALWRAADAIWRAMGDASTDFNWYTKRAILSAVIGSTLAAWLGADDIEDAWRFLDRRIEDVMRFEKTKADMRRFADGLPDPLDLIGRRR
jgi:ubiquinone biosynthesis protein COQ9